VQLSEPVGTLTVGGDDPRSVAPSFANFVGISHVGSEVQLEFIFLDINQIAQQIQRVQAGASGDAEMHGKTVAKVVVPVESFLQLKDHVSKVFERLEAAREAQHQKTAAERGYGHQR